MEVVRNLAEFVIFSEQNLQGAFFDIFCERNMLEHFGRLLNLKNRSVAIQLIQTTSILLANIKTETKKFYLLCHPFLTKLVEFDHNFFDEELVDIFVSFVKSLALMLNKDSVRFFYNHKQTHFPLLTVSQQFANHPETMVRNAVRIINLTVFSLNDPSINQDIIADVPFCTTFANLACLLRDKVCKGIDQSFSNQTFLKTKNQPQKNI